MKVNDVILDFRTAYKANITMFNRLNYLKERYIEGIKDY